MKDFGVVRRFLTWFAVSTACLFLTTGSAHAAVIEYRATGQFANISGGDVLGLNSASFTFHATFDADATYTELFSQPAVQSLSHSLTITDASEASVNGTYISDFPVTFVPTYVGQFFGGASGGDFITWTINSMTVTLYYLTSSIPGVNPGDAVALSHFGTLPPTGFHTLYASDMSSSHGWALTNLSVSVALNDGQEPPPSVPEPATLALLGVAAVSGLVHRRRSSGHRRP